MQEAFGPVLFAVCGVGVVVALVSLISSGKTWDEFGKSGRLMMDRDLPREPASSSGTALRERDEEIRQLLEARNARRERRGEAPVDVEQELQRLTAPLVDSALRAEIRDLVIARNHRRARTGKPPLDVEKEIERQIASLTEV